MSSPKLLIDTDPGVDDVLAILLALTTPSVCAITLTHGNTSLANAQRNLMTIFHVLDGQAKAMGNDGFLGSRPRIAIGSPAPLKGHSNIGSYFHGYDGIGNLTRTHPHLMAPHGDNSQEDQRYEVSPLDAVDEIIWQLATHPPGTLTILALGPLTNIAKVVEKDPAVLQRAKQVVVMGGAIACPGNISPLAEFNFYADPHAASVVLEATRGGAVRLVLVPLDITHTSFLTREFATARLASRLDPLAQLVFNMLRDSFGFTMDYLGVDAVALHDPLAAAIALGLICPTTETMAVRVECESALSLGASVADRRRNAPSLTAQDPHVDVCLSFPLPEKFQEQLLDAIFPTHSTT